MLWKQDKVILSQHQVDEIQNMLLCHDDSQGYCVFKCERCETKKVIRLSCNSRLCPRCGHRLTEEWADRIKKRLVKCDHRHCVFTLPNELWTLMNDNRELIKIVAAEILTVIKNVFKRQLRDMIIIPGIVAVMHTFGEDMKFNVHFHCLVTCRGLDKNGKWVAMPFFFYEGLRKVWQYHVLTSIKKALPQTQANSQFIDRMFKEHQNGFYVHAPDVVKHSQGMLAYIARYVRHPAIAQSRLVSFDGKAVTFKCKKHEDNVERMISMPVVDFLLALLQHIPPKGFQLIRHLGIYANRSREKYASVISMLWKIES